MNQNKISFIFFLIFLLLFSGCKNESKNILSIYKSKADSIIRLMTLEEKIGQLSLFTSELSYYHEDMSYTLDPDDFELFIGPNSSERLATRFTVL